MPLTLGQKIKELRIQKGLTQSELSQGFITPSMISQIESDKANPSHHVLKEIAARLETSVEYFLTDLHDQLQELTKYKLAKAQMSANDFKTAVNLLSGISDIPSSRYNYTEVRLHLGTCYYHLQQYDLAVQTLSDVLELAEGENEPHITVQALHTLGLVEIANKKHHRAIHLMRKAFEMLDLIDHLPHVQAMLAIDLGKAYNAVGDTEEALHAFQYANNLVQHLKDREVLAQTYIMLTNTCMSKDQFELANQYASVAHAILDAQSQIKLSIDVTKNLTLLQASTSGDLSSAVSALTQIVEQYRSQNLSYDAVIAMGDIAECYLQQSQYEQSVNWCDQALAEISDLPAILLTKGKALAKLEHFTDSITCLQTALPLFQAQDMPQEIANVYTVLAEVYEAQGELEHSILCLQNVKSSYEGAMRNRGIVL